MINIFLAVKYIIVSILLWFTVFLWHEMGHIKSQGLMMTGTIWIHKYGFTCHPDTVTDVELLSYAGGLLSSILSSICVFLVNDSVWQFGFLGMAWVNLAYGIYEGGPWSIKWRYVIYGIVLLIYIIFWWLIGGFNI